MQSQKLKMENENRERSNNATVRHIKTLPPITYAATYDDAGNSEIYYVKRGHHIEKVKLIFKS